MLLLLTLAGTRMIQQNKQQLNMAMNMQQQRSDLLMRKQNWQPRKQ
jgi:hypothetical protein